MDAVRVHPSLLAHYSGPPAPVARSTMGRNERCWCGSGDKWKKCHAGREAMEPISIFEVEADWRRRAQRGHCSHAPDGSGCASGIVKSHTVQRRGGLAAIAEGQSRVITVKPQSMRAMIDHDGRPPPVEIGIGNASVFPGFCGRHDECLFKPVEGRDVAMTADEALLFGYRAMAYERFTKNVQIESTKVQRQMDRGMPLDMQEAIQTRCHITEAGAKRALDQLDNLLEGYRSRIDGAMVGGFHHRAYRFDALLPLVACGAFMPELAVDGTRLQHLARGTAAHEQLTLTITSYAGCTVAVFGWLGSSNGPSATYVAAFESLPDADKADAIVQIAFEQLENIFLRPSWWKDLPEKQRADLGERIHAGAATNPRTPGAYHPARPSLAVAGIAERTWS